MENKLLINYIDVDIYQQEELILKDVNLQIYSGEFIYLVGSVASGKSSLLKSIYHDVPVVNGTAEVLGFDLCNLNHKDVPFLRRKIGIVFQDFQLLTDRNVFKNLEFVLKATDWIDQQAINERIEEVLTKVGMSAKATKMPYQLSGGEQQRIVIARALLNSPELILADEPTGHLDADTGSELVELLYNIRLSGTAVMMATHNFSWLDKFPGRVFRCENEKLEDLTAEEIEIIEHSESDK